MRPPLDPPGESPQAARALEHWPEASPHSAAGTRLNKRGRETRARLLDVAIRCLAEGGPEPVSANRIAKEAGVTWGTVNHQFGDIDGLWYAVVTEIHLRSWSAPSGPEPDRTGPLQARLEAAIDSVWRYLDTTEGRALTTLRAMLPQQSSNLNTEYPRTAAALAAREHDWIQGFDYLMDGLALDPTKLHQTRCLLPAAIRGLRTEHHLGFTTDLTLARRTLTEALTAFLT